jgi:hypothetical protein
MDETSIHSPGEDLNDVNLIVELQNRKRGVV